MSKVIVKVSYHNSGKSRKSVAGYVGYIAKREGVEIRNQEKQRPPDTTYADYIATRPGVEHRGAHGLFSIEDRPISLAEVSKELKEYEGNVWTVIVSLSREDADRVGYNNSEAWRQLITEKSSEIAQNFNLPLSQLNCYAAYHDAKEHPHIHMIIYSKDSKIYPGYHKQSSLQNMKSVFTRTIFEKELSDIYKMKTELRNELRQEGTDRMRALAEDIQAHNEVGAEITLLFTKLSESLRYLDGKKVYGYLPSREKELVDDILRTISNEARFQELYEKWYEQKELQQQYYNSEPIERVPIEENKEFISIKNAIVREASKINPKASDSENVVANAVATNIINLMCQIYVSKADEFELKGLENKAIVEEQREVDEALGLKHGE